MDKFGNTTSVITAFFVLLLLIPVHMLKAHGLDTLAYFILGIALGAAVLNCVHTLKYLWKKECLNNV